MMWQASYLSDIHLRATMRCRSFFFCTENLPQDFQSPAANFKIKNILMGAVHMLTGF